MEPREGSFTSPADATRLTTYLWGAEIESPRGVVQIVHGVSEHARRYRELAEGFVGAGFRVLGVDQRGHGASVLPGAPRGQMGTVGFRGVIADVAGVGEQLVAEHPGLPVFLLGHSMGSYAAQHVILDHSRLYAGVVLAGSAAVDVLAANMLAGGAIPTQPSAYNAGFEWRTGFEWLSRDEAMVDEYVADPLVCTELPEGTLIQLMHRSDRLADPDVLRTLPPELPILLVSGRADPLSGDGQLVALLAQRYRTAGLTDVQVQIYPGARHQIFIESNRAEIIGDVVDWCAAHT